MKPLRDDRTEVIPANCCYTCRHFYFGQSGDVVGMAACFRDVDNVTYDNSDEMFEYATYTYQILSVDALVSTFTTKCEKWSSANDDN